MSPIDDVKIEQIVERFLARRRTGARISIDDAMADIPDVEDAPAARASALSRIARRSRAERLSAVRDAAEAPAAFDNEDEFPEIDGYDIIDRVGRGGMGVVYEAYQRSTGRRVAVKFMLPQALGSESARRRFEREVELVARLQHPNIVSVIDSGAQDGRFYCVMEFVAGRPLDEAMTPGECDVREALAMVARVAEAVDYAHQRGVLHRDLKPTNVLVDDRNEPHLLDFGLAKAISPGADRPLALSLSQPGQLIGTLAYMSPEQSRGRFDQMSIRTDVYSLGAIAYELVTGRLPCDVDGALGDALMRIATFDPPRPSSLRRRVGADVDAILLKALEKQADRRYATAGAFAADIRRFLANEGIEARRAGPLRRSVRWVQRNRGVSAVGALALATIIALSLVYVQRVTAKSRDALATVDFLLGQFGSVDNFRTGRTDISLRDLLDGAVRALDARQAGGADPLPPRAEADLRNVFGVDYRNLSAYGPAAEQLGLALDLRRRIHGFRSTQAAEALHNHAAVLWWLGRYIEAEREYREALQIRESRHLARPRDPQRARQFADTLDHLAATLSRQRRFDDAVALADRSAEIRRTVLGEDHLDIARSNNLMSTILNARGRYGEVPALVDAGMRIQKRLDPDPRARGEASLLHNLAWSLFGVGDLSGAREQLTASIERKERVVPNSDVLADSLILRARIKLALGETQPALDDCERAISIRRARLPANHPDTAEALELLAHIDLALDRPREAERSLRECLAIRASQAENSDPWLTARARSLLGECLTAMSRFEEAESLLLAATDTLSAPYEGEPDERRTHLERLVRLYEAWNRPDDAQRYRPTLDSPAS